MDIEKYISGQNEKFSEISLNFTNQKFPTYMYDIYDKVEKGENIDIFLNKWCHGQFNSNNIDTIYLDEIWTVKKIDKESTNHLYGRDINPIFIMIVPTTGGMVIDEKYDMKACINSIDDSSYATWWKNIPITELIDIRIKLMKHINSHDILNGEKFLDYCESIGADPNERDYN